MFNPFSAETWKFLYNVQILNRNLTISRKVFNRSTKELQPEGVLKKIY